MSAVTWRTEGWMLWSLRTDVDFRSELISVTVKTWDESFQMFLWALWQLSLQPADITAAAHRAVNDGWCCLNFTVIIFIKFLVNRGAESSNILLTVRLRWLQLVQMFRRPSGQQRVRTSPSNIQSFLLISFKWTHEMMPFKSNHEDTQQPKESTYDWNLHRNQNSNPHEPPPWRSWTQNSSRLSERVVGRRTAGYRQTSCLCLNMEDWDCRDLMS